MSLEYECESEENGSYDLGVCTVFVVSNLLPPELDVTDMKRCG